jgi:hypothetical protein
MSSVVVTTTNLCLFLNDFVGILLKTWQETWRKKYHAVMQSISLAVEKPFQ